MHNIDGMDNTWAWANSKNTGVVVDNVSVSVKINGVENINNNIYSNSSYYDIVISDSSSNTNLATNSTLLKQPRWLLLGLAAIPAWIIFGNLMVLLAVRYHRSLRSLSNYVIASLAFTDFLLAAIVTPLGIYQVVHNQWALGLYACLIWTGSDVFLSTTSIMHLTAIAIHRYFGISYPLRVRSVGDLRHVACLLVPAWSISLAISIPLIIQGVRNPIGHVFIKDSNDRYQCGIFDRTFAIYSSLVSFFIPLAIMVFADIRSVQILRNNANMTIQAKPGHKNNSSDRIKQQQQLQQQSQSTQHQLDQQQQQPLQQQQNNNQNNTYNNAIMHSNCNNHFSESSNRLNVSRDPSVYELASSDSHSNYMTSSVMETRVDFRSHSVNRSVSNSSETVDDCYIAFSPNSTPTSERECRVFSPPTTPSGSERISKFGKSNNGGKRRKNTKSIGYIGMLSGRGLVKINSRERRAEKTLIWVFVCFVVLWLPFFTINLTYGICKKCVIPDDLFLAFTWLGYISSGVNPCIYTLLNRDFRNAFKSLIMCRHLKSSRKLNNAANSALYA